MLGVFEKNNQATGGIKKGQNGNEQGWRWSPGFCPDSVSLGWISVVFL